jgi:hypothetical protein
MFGHLTNLGHDRSNTEALGFGLFYTVFLAGLSGVLISVLGTLGIHLGDTVGGVFSGIGINQMVGTLFVLIMSTMILTSKKLTSDTLSVILSVVGIYVSYKIDVVVGMLIVAYLTTLKGK